MPDRPPSHPRKFASVESPRRILVRGVNWLGDAVMTTPALQRLRERFPAAHLALLTHEKLAGLWRAHPGLDAVLTFSPHHSLWEVVRRLRVERFELALILPNSPRAALESWLAGIPQRVGYARAWRSWLLTDAVPARPGRVRMRKRSPREIRRLVAAGAHDAPQAPRTPERAAHQVYEYLHLASAVGANPQPLPPFLEAGPEELESVRVKFDLKTFESTGRPLLGLNPGAEYGPAKRWPVMHFVEAAQRIQERTGCGWLLLGGPPDVPLAGKLEAMLRTPGSALFNLCGRTSLPELMAALKLCRALLTNDTGPMHVAAALGTPVVVPFGSTSPELTGPGLPGDPRHRLLKSAAPCSPCFRRSCPIDVRCMTGITVERVVEAMLELLRW